MLSTEIVIFEKNGEGKLTVSESAHRELLKKDLVTEDSNECYLYEEKDLDKIKKEVIKAYVFVLMNKLWNNTEAKVNKVFNSGCLDIEGYSVDYDRVVIPNAIYLAILQDEINSSTLTPQTLKEKENIENFL